MVSDNNEMMFCFLYGTEPLLSLWGSARLASYLHSDESHSIVLDTV